MADLPRPSITSTPSVCRSCWSVSAAILPGCTRGLDLFGRLACVGLSRIREAAAFGGLPLDARRNSLHCGVAVVDCVSGEVVAALFFRSGLDEIFDLRALPGHRNPSICGPYPDIDDTETIWSVPGGTPRSSSPNL